MDEMDTLLASDKLFNQNEKGNSLNKKQEKGGPKRNEQDKELPKIATVPIGTLVGPIYNIAFTEEVPFDCRNVTRFSHKHCCALFLPQTL